MQLSKRGVQITMRLIENETSLTTKELAKEFNVSIRTVKYDLDNLRDWLASKELSLQSQRNKGVWFELTDVQKIVLKNELNELGHNEVFANQDARVNQIIMHLLLRQDFCTIKELAEYLEVSSNTILADLDKVDTQLRMYDVTLIRKAGQGLHLTGPEKECRSLMEYVLQLGLSEYDIYNIMNILTKGDDVESAVKIVLCKEAKFNELYQNILKSMAKALDLNILSHFDYAELLALSLRVTISISRLQNNWPIGSLHLLSLTNESKNWRVESLSTLKNFFAQYDIPLLKDEYEYIMNHKPQKVEQSDALALAVDLVKSVSAKMDLPFDRDKELISNLFAHLSLRLSKKRIYTNEYNPFIDDILLKNRQLFTAIKEALEAKKDNYAYLLNDSFVAYIALHFLVSMEKQQKEVVQVIYVCSTGLGVTKFIEQRIAQEVSNVEIVDFVSILNADAVIKAKKPDLVISIFPIDSATCPVIKVHAIPSVEDMENIKGTVQQLLDTGSAHILKKLRSIIH